MGLVKEAPNHTPIFLHTKELEAPNRSPGILSLRNPASSCMHMAT